MTHQFDPYEHLGVQRDAGTATIRAGYRARAFVDHPDRGGDAEQWRLTQLALQVLTDPALRQRYDEAGVIAAAEPSQDNKRSAALGVIDQHIAAVINRFPAGGFRPEDDPARFDMVSAVRLGIERDLEKGHEAVAGGLQHIAYLAGIRRRFRLRSPDRPIEAVEDDPISRNFARQIEGAEQQVAQLRTSIEVHAMALNLLADYAYEAEGK